MLISVGWLPPYWCPSRRLLRSRDEGRSLLTRSKIAPIPGPRRRRWLEIIIIACEFLLPAGRCPSRRQRHAARDGPGKGGHLARDGHDDLVDVLAASGQLPIPTAQPHLRLPADRLDF